MPNAEAAIQDSARDAVANNQSAPSRLAGVPRADRRPLGLAEPGGTSREGVLAMPRSSQPAASADTIEGARRTRTPGHGGGGPLERVTVNLTAKSSRALEAATELSGDTKTDTINRALQIYAFLQQVTARNGAIYVRESEGAELERLKIIL